MKCDVANGFYAAGFDSATTSKTSKNAFSNKYLRVVKTWVFSGKIK
jgi:hypothetical protein